MLWIFDAATGKLVTKEEFRESVIPRLRSRGLSNDDIDFVRTAIDGALNEGGTQNGVTEEEIEQLIKTMREHAPDHFSDENLKKVEEELRRKL